MYLSHPSNQKGTWIEIRCSHRKNALARSTVTVNALITECTFLVKSVARHRSNTDFLDHEHCRVQRFFLAQGGDAAVPSTIAQHLLEPPLLTDSSYTFLLG